jgi:hypothetical protein
MLLKMSEKTRASKCLRLCVWEKAFERIRRMGPGSKSSRALEISIVGGIRGAAYGCREV